MRARESLDNKLPEAGEVVSAGRAHVEPGRHAAAGRDRVGSNAIEAAAVVDVRMQIDQPGRYVLAAGVHDAKGRLGRNVRLDRGNAVALDRHVQAAALPAAGVNHFAALDQKIESHVSAFRVFFHLVDSYCGGQRQTSHDLALRWRGPASVCRQPHLIPFPGHCQVAREVGAFPLRLRKRRSRRRRECTGR